MKVHHSRLKNIIQLLIVWALCLIATLPAAAYTVVIDAGHGGKDHGAIDNSVREKDINLGVALRLAKLLKKHHKGLKVVLTRDKDEYLTLQQRADIANHAHGDLFISIHTNSVAETNPNRTTVAGVSTYTLGLHKDAANMEVARRENNVMTYESNYDTKYAGFDPNSDESYIIFEMAQKANMVQSVKFANEVQRQMSKVAARRDRGVHQAGFWVLWATSMPAALVELDFICNPNSAKFLGSEQGQEKLAQALCNAVGEYFTALEKHEKERLRTEQCGQDTPPAGTTETAAAELVTLEAVVPTVPKSTDAPATATVPAERTRRPAARRRRSESARQKSCEQEYAVAVIPEQTQYVAAVSGQAPEQPQAQQQPPAKPDKKSKKASKKSKKKKKERITTNQTTATTRTVGGKKVYVVTAANATTPQQVTGTTTDAQHTSVPATEAGADTAERSTQVPDPQTRNESPRSGSTSPVRLARVNTVYKIQIYSCDKILKEKDPLFGGLYPVTCSKTADNIYTYYYGESASQGEIYRLLSDVKKVFPGAKVVKARRQ